MESKKVNIFALLMIIVMCAVSIYIGVGKNDNVNHTGDILSIYKKLETLDEKIDNSTGKSAYQLAVENGYTGTEGEWLQSLKGTNGTNALTNVSVREIYTSYLQETNKTEDDMSYEEFLLYYYSVIEKYDTKSATQLAYSTTVDICNSYVSDVRYITEVETSSKEVAYVVNTNDSGLKGGISAGAGVIYQMMDTDKNSELDTAYIITNYHVAYIDNYSNDPNYIVYCEQFTDLSTGRTASSYTLGTSYKESDLKDGSYNYAPCKYFMKDAVEFLSIDEGISKHFLIGTNDQFYGIYLYGYQDERYEVKASYVGGSADNDIAVLKIERDNLSEELAEIFFDSGNYYGANLGNSTDLVGGEEVIAVGNPLLPNTSEDMTFSEYKTAYVDALVLSSTTGVVSSISNELDFGSMIDDTATVTMRLIRVDAAINSGNSGGGLYDLYGRLVGIVNSKIASSSYDNVGYAIPINVAVSVANQVISQCDGQNPTSTNTRIKRLETQNLGFDIERGDSKSKVEIDSNGKKQWLVSYNILVKNVAQDSVAHTSGLQNDDIIKEISFDGGTYSAETYFNLDYELRDLLLNVSLNATKLTLKVSRMGEIKTIEINLSLQNFTEIN